MLPRAQSRFKQSQSPECISVSPTYIRIPTRLLSLTCSSPGIRGLLNRHFTGESREDLLFRQTLYSFFLILTVLRNAPTWKSSQSIASPHACYLDFLVFYFEAESDEGHP